MLIEDTKGNIFRGLDKCFHDIGSSEDKKLAGAEIKDLNFLFKFCKNERTFLKFKLKDEIVK